LPKPIVEREGEKYFLNYDLPHSIGRMKAFYGNIGVVLKAYAYVRSLGARGLKEASEMAVLNANYLKKQVEDLFEVPVNAICKHEFVVSASNWKEKYGVRALDIAKRLLDYGFHPPTIYFPLIVEEALMIEPTETESKEALDAFAASLKRIYDEAQENPDLMQKTPHHMPVKRVDEVKAAREMKLKY
jgi:glycine dehydrogenase subunit 2